MAITREKKGKIIDDISQSLKDSSSASFVSFSEISANDMNAMRRKLSKEGVTFFVIKKTLLYKILKENFQDGDVPTLSGEIGVSFGEDPIAPARAILDLSKKDKLNLSIEGGIYDGEIVSKEKMNTIASIPSRDVLLAKFSFVIRAPLYKFAAGLKEKSNIK